MPRLTLNYHCIADVDRESRPSIEEKKLSREERKLQLAIQTFQRQEENKKKKVSVGTPGATSAPKPPKPAEFIPHRKRKPSDFMDQSSDTQPFQRSDSPQPEYEHKKRRYVRKESLGTEHRGRGRPKGSNSNSNSNSSHAQEAFSPSSSPSPVKSTLQSPMEERCTAPLVGKKAWMRQFIEDSEPRNESPRLESLTTSKFVPLKKKIAHEFFAKPEPATAPVAVSTASVAPVAPVGRIAPSPFKLPYPSSLDDPQVKALLEIANLIAERAARAAKLEQKAEEDLLKEKKPDTPVAEKVKEEVAPLPFQDLVPTAPTTPAAKVDPSVDRQVKVENTTDSVEPPTSQEKQVGADADFKEDKGEEDKSDPTPSKTRFSLKDYMQKKKHSSPLPTPPVQLPLGAMQLPTSPLGARAAYFDLPVTSHSLTAAAPPASSYYSLPAIGQQPRSAYESRSLSSSYSASSSLSLPFNYDPPTSWQGAEVTQRTSQMPGYSRDPMEVDQWSSRGGTPQAASWGSKMVPSPSYQADTGSRKPSLGGLLSLFFACLFVCLFVCLVVLRPSLLLCMVLNFSFSLNRGLKGKVGRHAGLQGPCTARRPS